MSRVLSLLLLTVAMFATTASAHDPDTLVREGYDQKAMQQAIQRARKEVDRFVVKLKSGDGEDYAVKMKIEDGDHVEHFWITDVRFDGQSFHGAINNEPGIVKNVKLGQKVSVAKTEISDWMWIEDDKMYGNYTLRPLLPTLPPAQARALRSMLAEP